MMIIIIIIIIMHFECCPISSWFTGSAPEDLSLHPIHR